MHINQSDLIKDFKNLRKKYSNMVKQVEKCPICNNKYFNIEFRDLIRLKNLELYILVDDSYISCNRFGLIMRDKIWPSSYYKEYINKFYDVIPYTIPTYSYDKANIRLDILNKLSLSFNTILEVSSFDGVTLNILKKNFNADVYGIEPTEIAVQTSIREFNFSESNIINDVFENILNYKIKHKFDLVLFSYCFRQINDPLKTLKILNEITSNNAIVLIDEGFLLETVILNNSIKMFQRDMFVQKCFYYSIHNLEFLMSKFNFKLLNVICLKKPVRYVGMIFKKEKTVPREELLEISKVNAFNILNILKKFYYSTKDAISALKMEIK